MEEGRPPGGRDVQPPLPLKSGKQGRERDNMICGVYSFFTYLFYFNCFFIYNYSDYTY